MSQLRMFLDIEKHPLPDYPVPDGFRVTRNGPEVAERYEIALLRRDRYECRRFGNAEIAVSSWKHS